jgi:HAD superfamily hydrolase (TIGR01549 family)
LPKKIDGLLSKFDLFVFDWDGTLSSVKVLRLVNEKVNPFWNLRKINSKTVRVVSQDETDKIIRRKELSNAAKGIFAPVLDLSITLMKPKLHNGAKDVLRVLDKRNKKIAILTNGAVWRAVREIAYLKIENYFEVIVSAQELDALKPNPLGLEVIIDATKTKKDRVLYIGDMVDDVLAARGAGVRSCAVSCGFDSHNDLKSSRPDYIFRSLEEFRDAL